MYRHGYAKWKQVGNSCTIIFLKLTPKQHSLLCSFYLMVYAYNSYTDGNLQLFGNVQRAELDGECTGSDCLTEGEVTTPPPPSYGLSKYLVTCSYVHIHNLHNKYFFLISGISIPNAEHTSKKTFLVTCNGSCRQIRAHIEFDGGDADLFANEGQHPITSGLSCLSSTCAMCRAVSGDDYEETCSDMSTQSGNRYEQIY